MTADKEFHLDEDLLLQAVVDEADLPEGVQEHLRQCARCRTEKERIDSGLLRLGQMAERFSPPPGRKFFLPPEKSQKSSRWSWQWHAAFGMALTALLIISVFGINRFSRSGHRTIPVTDARNMLSDEEFTDQINMLAENALPPEYLDIIGETDFTHDETFMDFLVPGIGEDPFTRLQHDKNVSTCVKTDGVRMCHA